MNLIFTLPTISVVFHHCKYFDYCLLKFSSWLELKGTTFICLSSYPTTTHPAAESPDSPLQVQLLTQGTPTISWTTQESHMQPYNKHNSTSVKVCWNNLKCFAYCNKNVVLGSGKAGSKIFSVNLYRKEKHILHWNVLRHADYRKWVLNKPQGKEKVLRKLPWN